MTYNLEDLIRGAYARELRQGVEFGVPSGRTPDCLRIPDIAEWRRFGFNEKQRRHLLSGCRYCEMALKAVFSEACPEFGAMYSVSSQVGGSLMAAHANHIERCAKCFGSVIAPGTDFVPSVYSLAGSTDDSLRLPGREAVQAFTQHAGIDLKRFPWVERVVALMKEYPAALWRLTMSGVDAAALNIVPQGAFAEALRGGESSGRARRAGSGPIIADSLDDGLSATLTPEADVMWSVEWAASKANAGRQVQARVIFSDGSEYPKAIVRELSDNGTAQVSLSLDFGAALVVSFVVQFVA